MEPDTTTEMPTPISNVDPDESDLNNHVSEALKAEKFPLEKYGSIAIINMAATWLPNFALNMKLKSKQENYKNTVYVKDLQKILVQELSFHKMAI